MKNFQNEDMKNFQNEDMKNFQNEDMKNFQKFSKIYVFVPERNLS